MQAFEHHGGGQSTPNRLIGIEVRLVSPYGEEEEVAIFPLDISLPEVSLNWRFNVTIHTKRGDVSIGANRGYNELLPL